MDFLPYEVIKKKRDGLALNENEIRDFIIGYTKNLIPDYQMSALLMAIYFKGMNDDETLSLTKAMMFSGVTVDFSDLKLFTVDKHSTGGVGDKTSLILGPIVASLGIPVPMIAGRGLGHTGGTIDKLESIPGFNTQIPIEKFKQLVAKYHFSLIGQTSEICPADKKIYGLRDVTATIESFPLICASILSKKLAEGANGLVLDVKFGSGAFMKDAEQAKHLALELKKIGEGFGRKMVALVTNMNQPMGRYCGNSLEIHECAEILQNKKSLREDGVDLYADTRELSIQLSAWMIYLSRCGEKTATVNSGLLNECRVLAQQQIENGQAYKKFKELCKIQDGDLSKLPLPSHKKTVLATEDGFISAMNTQQIGIAGILLKAGRTIATDAIEPTAGIEFHVKIGDPIKKGTVLFTIHGSQPDLFAACEANLQKTISYSAQPTRKQNLIQEILY